VAGAGEERLDLGHDRLPVTGEEDVIVARQCHEARVRHPLRQVAGEVDAVAIREDDVREEELGRRAVEGARVALAHTVGRGANASAIVLCR
jgi:hypothetical protein